MAFQGNVRCLIYKLSSKTNLYGERHLEKTPIEEKCGVIRLEVEQEQTSVRVDSSASRAHADEIRAQSRILFEKTSQVAIGDKVTVQGQELEVRSVFPRNTVNGELDHYQADLSVWGSR